jgi:hypothetical protein
MLTNIFFTFALVVFSITEVSSISDNDHAASIFDSSDRGLQTFIDKYKITFQNAVYVSGALRTIFHLHAGDEAASGRFEVFTAPENADPTGDPTLSCYSNGGEFFNDTATGSGLSRQTTVINPGIAFCDNTFLEDINASSPFYYEIGESPDKQIKFIFCVKLTLTQEIEGIVTDMNFKEAAIQMNVALNGTLGGSSVDAFEVDTGAAGTDTDNDLEYTASAGLCSTFSGNPTQGENIPICIVSDDHPLASIVSVQDLSFTSGDSLTQSIIASGSAAPGAADLYGVPDPLNAAHCLVNKCIQYNVMLYAIFATVGDNLDITIRGNVVLAIGDGTRTLRAQFKPTRALQDALREQAFSSTIVLPALPTTESGAVSTVGTKITAAMVSLGAALVSGWMFAV